MIDSDYQSRLYEYIGGIIRNQGGIGMAINGTQDHVHILAKLRQDKAVSDMIRDFKANSSGWLHKFFPSLDEFSWQNGYAAFTVSASQIERVKSYIANQQRHHQRRSFKDEFIALLKANNIEFDEGYLWK